MLNSLLFVFNLLLVIFPPLFQIDGFTHWKVTSSDSIVPVSHSLFHLRQPSRLITLLRQEDFLNYIDSSDLTLNLVSDNLYQNQQYQKHVHNLYIDSNSACVKATKLLIEFDLHSTHILTLEAKGISSKLYLREEKLKNVKNIPKRQLHEPFCDLFFNQTFSMCCFDHLDSIKNRSFYQSAPEISLYKLVFPHHLTPSEYGYLVYLALKDHHKSSSINWILYNMAAFYWRVKGSAKNSIACLRAALHTSPNQYLDVALVSLANVLHLIKSTSKDAVILMVNAIWVSPHFSSHHLILGNIFASLGEYNNSLHHFQMAAKLHRPDKDQTKLKDIEERIFAARCSYELSIAIANQQYSLNQQIKNLNTFQRSTDQYHNAKTLIEQERINNITQSNRQKVYEAYVEHEEMQLALLEQCSLSDPISRQIVRCDAIQRNLISRLFKKFTKYESPEKMVKEHEIPYQKPTHPRKYTQLFYNEKQKDKPIRGFNKSYCQKLDCFTFDNSRTEEKYASVNLSPGNKGFDVGKILMNGQGLENGQEHALPWHPPYCMLYVEKDELSSLEVVENLSALKSMNFIEKKDEKYTRIVDQTLLVELKKLVNNSDVRLEDIGQRIVTALTNKSTPLWITLDMAGLYWRVMGNHLQAIECQRLSIQLCPNEFRDVPMVNLAAVLLLLNHTQDALKLTKSALQIDYSEPETHLLAAGLFKKYENYYLAFKHYNIANKQERLVEFAELDRNFVRCNLCKNQKTEIEDIASDDDESAEIYNIFMKYKMCISVQECKNVIPNNLYHLPHIKISSKGNIFSQTDLNGVSGSSDTLHKDDLQASDIMYGFLWNINVSNLNILDQDCFVINDSMRTIGCHRDEDLHQASLNGAKFLEELRYVFQRVSDKEDSSSKKQSCYSDHSEKSVFHDESNSLKFSSVDLHDDILKLISSRVVLKPIAPEDCEHVAPFDFKTYTPLYVSLSTMQVNVVTILDSLTPAYSFTFSHQPHCSPKRDKNFLVNILDKYMINFDDDPRSKVPEYNLHVSFLKTFEDRYTLEEIGKRLYTGLKENSSDWRLATVVVNYWRVYGDSFEAFKCLQLAMETSPNYHVKVILVNAANILYRINKPEAALEISHRALQCQDGQKWVVIPFLVANIFASMGHWQKAILFYESCLSIKGNFEEAIYRIKSIQCQQIVLNNLEQP